MGNGYLAHVEGVRGSWVFPPAGQSAAEARHLVRDALSEVSADAREVAMLLTSELVTNAVRHGDGPVGVSLTTGASGIRIDVHDQGPKMPSVQARDLAALGGRGLLLVEALSAGWGVEHDESGKSVWFSLRT